MSALGGKSGLDMLTTRLAACDLGCVKTRNKITCAQQKNRTRSSAEFNMCLRALTYINVAPDDFENRFYTTKTRCGGAPGRNSAMQQSPRGVLFFQRMHGRHCR